MNDIVYVVKSHQRVQRFFDKTFSKIIIKYKFPLDKVFVFVSLDSDVECYKLKYPGVNIVKAPKGVAAVDNFITDYFPSKQKMIYMNDDVSQIKELKDNKLSIVEHDKLMQIINVMFSKMVQNKITYGGFYPVPNDLFMSGKKVKYGLCLIMDPFSFVINNKNVRITISDKSDFEKSIQHFHLQGALMRYNHAALSVEYYGSKGGFQGRNEATEMESAKKMLAKYPGFISGIKVKKEGKTSLRLKNLEPTKTVK